MSHNLPPVFNPHNQYPEPSGYIKKKQGLFSWLFKLLVSPTSAFVFAFLGYYSLAGFTNIFLPEGSLGGILIRALTLGILILASLRFSRKWPSKVKIALFFLNLFLFFYFLRLIENIYFSGVYIPPGPTMLFSIFIVSSIISPLALTKMAYAIRDDQFVILASFLSFIFLAGMAFNLETLQATSTHRMSLGKMNAISMAHTAFAFVVYYLLFFSRSKRLKIETLIIVPVLLIILVYARTRGAYLAGGASIMIYIMLLKGTKRLWIILGLVLVTMILLSLNGTEEQINLILKSLQRLSSSDDMSAQLHMLAWSGAWQQFMEDFAFGRYAIELQTAFYPHNIYLEVVMSVGFLGAIPFVIYLGLATRAAVGIIRSNLFPLTATFIAIMFFREAIASAGAGSVWGASGFWVTSSLSIAFWYGQKSNIYTQQIFPTTIQEFEATKPHKLKH